MLELLVLAIAPALFIFLYIYPKDRYEPEPLHLVARVFFLGALSVFPEHRSRYRNSVRNAGHRSKMAGVFAGIAGRGYRIF